MRTFTELEDTFGDIVRKASSGTRMSVDRLSEQTKIPRARLAELLGDRDRPTQAEAQTIAVALGLDPKKLADSGARRFFPSGVSVRANVMAYTNAPQPSNGYIFFDRAAGIGAVVDPAGSAQAILEKFEHAEVTPKYILVTHKHADHADALPGLRKAVPKATIVMHETDARELGDAARGAQPIQDGDQLPFGKGSITAIYTPGHTDGSSCFIYDGSIFTGDTLFAASIGRTNGPRTTFEQHRENIKTKILTLPNVTVILPGHGPPSTVELEQAHNPFFPS